MPMKIIMDTDIGEDIDDILACAFALQSPEFEVLAITTVDGDTRARARIARNLLQVAGRPEIPVAAGYALHMPRPDPPCIGSKSVTQFDLAPVERGLPPASPLRADELIAKLACALPGQISLLTIGAMTNVGQLFVRYPEAASRLRGVISNGGVFGPGRETGIGWNLRYDPLAAAIVARGPVPWVLLPENATGPAALRGEEVARLRASEAPLARLLTRAIELWRKNKTDATRRPHLSDLNVLAYLLGGWIRTWPGRAILSVPPNDRLAQLRLEEAAGGPHELGGVIARERGSALREQFLERILAPVAQPVSEQAIPHEEGVLR